MAVKVWTDHQFPPATVRAGQSPSAAAGYKYLHLGDNSAGDAQNTHMFGLFLAERVAVPVAPAGFYGVYSVIENTQSGANFVVGVHAEGNALAAMTAAEGFAGIASVDAGVAVGNIRGIFVSASSGHSSGTATITNSRGIWMLNAYAANTVITTYEGFLHDWTALGAGSTVTTAYGVRITMNPSNGTITTGYGVHLSTVKGTTAWGFFQDGSEQNKFKGRLLFATPNSALTDGDMENASTSLYLDQTNHALKVRAKYSDGTLKLGTIPFGNSGTSSQAEWQYPVRTVTTSVTINPEDTCILVNTASSITLTLPAANAHTPRGKMLILLKTPGNFFGRVTVLCAGADTIDSTSATSVFFENGETVMQVFSDGSSRWYAMREVTGDGG